MALIPTVCTRTGARMPVLGLGTWLMGEDPRRRAQEVAALKLGLDRGMTLVDTAEMYADGRAEEVVAEAIRGRRQEVFLVSKVLPYNASKRGTVRAAEKSLGRLGTDWMDLYLLHWLGSHPLEGTLEAFERLEEQGKIRHFGVSNFDILEMEAAEGLPAGGKIAVNQVLYNLERRGIERRLLSWCEQKDVVVMAYSPLGQGSLGQRRTLVRVAERNRATTAQVALAWTLRQEGVVTIPKASRSEHVIENAAAMDLTLTDEDLTELDKAYPVPPEDIPLETL